MSRWTDFEEEVGPKIADALSRTAPVSTGQLAASHSWRDEDNHRLEAISTDDRGPIATFVTRGTQPHVIEPVNAQFLHFFASGGEVFTKHVNHPGTQPNPYHHTAWESVRDEVISDFARIVGQGSVLAMLNPWRDRVMGSTSLPSSDETDALDGTG